MKPLMDVLYAEFQKAQQDKSEEPEATPVPEGYSEGAGAFHKFSVNWLNNAMRSDYVILDAQNQQYVLTDRAGSGSLPETYAVHAIGNPVRRELPPTGAVRVNG